MLKVRDPIDSKGKITPVEDHRFAGAQNTAFVVEAEDGFYYFMTNEANRCDSFGEAMSQIERRSS